ncbi:MAG: bifunctional phosphoglucose/phosphomannose isomerase [Crenarchaeota archaeon]|nr:bifunctional phosphoglucose/phosphomannose isomerase [Thermoproteota archaeon]MDW8034344.1 bifunctional phosphoglucose/phosphomannose isomerase [Nitrososphaerota archaeon]
MGYNCSRFPELSLLDDEKAMNNIDCGNMRVMIYSFPKLVSDAFILSQNLKIPDRYRKVKEIIVCGMGGSAIGGDLFKDLSNIMINLNVSVIRDYDLPKYVDENSLVVAVSYSGNTEETLECFKQAYERRACILGIASNGLLEKACSILKIPFLRVPGGYQPRAALPLLFIPLLKVSEAIGFPMIKDIEVKRLCWLLEQYNKTVSPESPIENNPAKKLAIKLYGKIPVVYSLGHLKSVALRYKDQINENAKMRAMCDQIPELNHNEIEAWERIDFKELLYVVLIDTKFKNKYIAESIKELVSKIEKEGVGISVITPPGETMIEEMLTAILLGDWVSYYLAMLRRVDPTPVSLISEFKKRREEKVKYSEAFEEWLSKACE